MIFFLVQKNGQVTISEYWFLVWSRSSHTEQTESDAYEATVHAHRWDQKLEEYSKGENWVGHLSEIRKIFVQSLSITLKDIVG